MPFHKFFRCFNDFTNVSLRWLNNVSGVYLVQVSLLLIGQQGLVDFLRVSYLDNCVITKQ